MSQTCNTCNLDQPEENYYVKHDIQLFKKCKSCIKAAKTREKKPRGCAALAPEVQTSVRAQLADRRQKMTEIAEQHGIKYANLIYWVRNNMV